MQNAIRRLPSFVTCYKRGHSIDVCHSLVILSMLLIEYCITRLLIASQMFAALDNPHAAAAVFLDFGRFD
jgi:hypothetical protein